MMVRSVCWVALGALSVACAGGVFATQPQSDIEKVTASEGATTIKGAVYDSDRGEPIEQAVLVLQCDCLSGQRETQTNANGVFAFRGLPPGTYSVQVLHGSADMTKVVPIRVDQTVRLRFKLVDEPHVVT